MAPARRVDLGQRQRPAVEQHDDERLARGLDRVDQLLLVARAGRARCATAASPLISAALAEREHDLVGGVRRRDGGRERRRRSRSRPPGRAVRRLVVRQRAALGERRVRVLRLDAGEEADTASASGPGPTTGRACRAGRRRAGRSPRPTCWGRAGASRRRSSAAPSTSRPRCARRRGRRRSRSCAGSAAFAWSTYGWSNSPARNLTRRIRRTASSSRAIEMRCSREQLLAEVADVRAHHLRVGAGVQRRRAAPGPSAATPCPHGPVSGFFGGQARSSATAV